MSSINRVGLIPADSSATGAELIEVKDADGSIKSIKVSDIRLDPYVSITHTTGGTGQTVDITGVDELIYDGIGVATFDAFSGAVAGQELAVLNRSGVALTLSYLGGAAAENDIVVESGSDLVVASTDGSVIIKFGSVAAIHPSAGGTGVSGDAIG